MRENEHNMTRTYDIIKPKILWYGKNRTATCTHCQWTHLFRFQQERTICIPYPLQNVQNVPQSNEGVVPLKAS